MIEFCKISFFIVTIVFYFLGYKDVCRCPKCDVHAKQQVGIDVCGKQDIQQCKNSGGQHDGDHGRALTHTDGEQLVVDMVLVGQEGILAVAHTVEIDTHHIEAWHQQGSEGHYEGIDMMG